MFRPLLFLWLLMSSLAMAELRRHTVFIVDEVGSIFEIIELEGRHSVIRIDGPFEDKASSYFHLPEGVFDSPGGRVEVSDRIRMATWSNRNFREVAVPRLHPGHEFSIALLDLNEVLYVFTFNGKGHELHAMVAEGGTTRLPSDFYPPLTADLHTIAANARGEGVHVLTLDQELISFGRVRGDDKLLHRTNRRKAPLRWIAGGLLPRMRFNGPNLELVDLGTRRVYAIHEDSTQFFDFILDGEAPHAIKLSLPKDLVTGPRMELVSTEEPLALEKVLDISEANRASEGPSCSESLMGQ